MCRKILYSFNIDDVQYVFYENQIARVIYPEFVQIDLKLAQKTDDLIREFDLPPQAIVAEFPSFTDISSQARKYWASHEVLEKGISHAGVLENRTLLFLANAYLLFNKPKIATKFYYDLESALSWSEKQVELSIKDQQSKNDQNSLQAK